MPDREALGRLVREVWVEWAREQPDPKPSHLVGWDDLDEGNREVDMRIGDALWNMIVPPPAVIMRTGRHLSQTDGLCTLYRVTGDDWKDHECVGMVKTPEIAQAICEAVNARGIPLPAREDEVGVPGTGGTEGNVAGSAGLVGRPAPREGSG
jgi:hypothetical protein